MKTIFALLFTALVTSLFSCTKKDLINPDVAVKDKTTGGSPGSGSHFVGKIGTGDFKANMTYNLAAGQLVAKKSETDQILFDLKPQYDRPELGTLLVGDRTDKGYARLIVKQAGKPDMSTAGLFWSIGTLSIQLISSNKMSGTCNVNFTVGTQLVNVQGTFTDVPIE